MQFSRGRGFPRGGGGFRGGARGGSFNRGRGGPRGGGFRGRGDGRPSPYSARGEDTRTINPTKLHVSNVPEGVTSSELEALFEKCGKVLECDVIRDFAFVHYKSSAEADAAVEQLHGYEIRGSTINVRHSTSTLRQKPGTHKGDCFRCGGRGHSSVECPTELREKGLLPPMTMGSTYHGGFDSFDPYEMPAADPYFDPYERMENDPFYRRRVAAALAADPYLGGGAPRGMPRGDPYGRGRGRGASAIANDDSDPYARPPPEFYQRRGRGRGAAAAAGFGAANGSSYGRVPNRAANDPYFYKDDYEKSADNGNKLPVQIKNLLNPIQPIPTVEHRDLGLEER